MKPIGPPVSFWISSAVARRGAGCPSTRASLASFSSRSPGTTARTASSPARNTRDFRRRAGSTPRKEDTSSTVFRPGVSRRSIGASFSAGKFSMWTLALSEEAAYPHCEEKISDSPESAVTMNS